MPAPMVEEKYSAAACGKPWNELEALCRIGRRAEAQNRGGLGQGSRHRRLDDDQSLRVLRGADKRRSDGRLARPDIIPVGRRPPCSKSRHCRPAADGLCLDREIDVRGGRAATDGNDLGLVRIERIRVKDGLKGPVAGNGTRF